MFLLYNSFLSIIISLSYGIAINEFLDIEIYSRGLSHSQINNELYSFIKINGESVTSSFIGKGFNGIILNETNGDIINQINANTHDNLTAQDLLLNNFLSTATPNNIIILTVYDSPQHTGVPPSNTIATLQGFGCFSASTMGYRSAFIFIGTPNRDYTYCDVTNENGTAILQSFQIPITGLLCIDMIGKS